MVCAVKGGASASKKVIESVKLFSQLANIGDAKSLAPTSGIDYPFAADAGGAAEDGCDGDDYIGLAVGIEDIGDIIDDLNQALQKV